MFYCFYIKVVLFIFLFEDGQNILQFLKNQFDFY